MGLNLEAFIASRPYVYHLTSAINLPSVRRTRTLRSAADLLGSAGMAVWLDQRRRESVEVIIDETKIVIRDQKPLAKGNIEFQGGMTFETFVRYLNSHVYFWPGTSKGPIDYGVRHFQRYADEATAILRVPTAELLIENPGVPPKYCLYNSGSPRCSGGRRSPRSEWTHLVGDQFPGTASQVVELVFRGSVRLPVGTQLSDGGESGFTGLFRV